MKSVRSVLLVAIWLIPKAASAQDVRAADTAQIRSTLERMNQALRGQDPDELSAAFTANCEVWFDGSRMGEGSQAIQRMLDTKQVWSEQTPPHLEAVSIRLVSADVVLVDAAIVRYGSLVLRRAQPVLLVFRLNDGQWRATSFRIYSTAGFPVRSRPEPTRSQ